MTRVISEGKGGTCAMGVVILSSCLGSLVEELSAQGEKNSTNEQRGGVTRII